MSLDEQPAATQISTTLDASILNPQLRTLMLQKSTVPDGELARLPLLESLSIHSLSNRELDLAGRHSLRSLSIAWSRHLEEIRGLDECHALEFLFIDICHRLVRVPSLAQASALKVLHIGGFTDLESISPFLDAPHLEEVHLWGTVPISADALRRLQTHPTLAVFSWDSPRKVPVAVVDHVTAAVAKPRTAEEARKLRRQAAHREATRPSAEAPAIAGDRLKLHVACSTATEYGGFYPVYAVGDLLLDEAPDFGPALTKIEIDLFPWEAEEGMWSKTIAEFNASRESLPKIRFRRSAGSVIIRASSALNVPRLRTKHKATAVPLFRQACTDVLAALETLRERVKPTDDFDLERFLAWCATILDRIPESASDLDEWIAAANERRRVADQAASNELPFPGWRPGEPNPWG